MGRPKKKDEISIRQIEAAIKASGGMLRDAADMLGCSHPNLCQRVSRSEKLQAIMEKYEKVFVKVAESNLMKGLEEGNPTYTMFYLKCKGGYSERQNINLFGNVEAPLIIERIIVKKEKTEDTTD